MTIIMLHVWFLGGNGLLRAINYVILLTGSDLFFFIRGLHLPESERLEKNGIEDAKHSCELFQQQDQDCQWRNDKMEHILRAMGQRGLGERGDSGPQVGKSLPAARYTTSH